MNLFRKQKKSVREDSSFSLPYSDLVKKLITSDSELLRIIGPEDGGSVCGDWVGSVVSVSGKSKEWPALIEAVEDGVFHPGCRHRLESYKPEQHETEAKFCTQLALAARDRRRNGDAQESANPVTEMLSKDPSPEQMDFEKLYAAARKAEASGAAETALAKCEAALDVLHAHDMYGEQQAIVEKALEARIRTILLARSSS